MEADGRICKTNWSQYCRINQIKATYNSKQQAGKSVLLNENQRDIYESIWNWNHFSWHEDICSTSLAGCIPKLHYI